MVLRLAAIQFSPQKGNLDANICTMISLAQRASSEGADLCVFPESAACGYILEGATRDHSMTAEEFCIAWAPLSSEISKPVDIVAGFYEKNDGQPFNSAAYIEVVPGEIPKLVGVYRKFFLPTYGVFDEERFHTRGRELGVFQTRFGLIGILICEDVWHSILATLSAVNGAQILLVPSASPARGFKSEKPGNVLRYERMLRGISEEHGIFTAASMLTGFEGGKGFSGGSMILDPDGNMLAQCEIGDEAMVIAEVNLDLIEQARNRTPLVGDIRSVWSDITRLVNQTLP